MSALSGSGVNAKEANRRARRGQKQAEQHVEPLRAKYEAVLRANASRVALAYRRHAQAMTAAAGDKPPNVPTLDEVLASEVLAASATARTKAERQRIAESAAQPIISDMGRRELRAFLEPIVAAQAGVQAERIVAGVQDRVAAIILEVLTEGMSVPDAAALLQSTLELDAEWQATMLARTDLIAISNAASHKAAASLEDGPRFKTWLSAGDDRVRPSHVEADGQTVAIDSPYLLAEGVQLQYPGDPAGPDGEVINCRCVSVFTDTPAPLLRHSGAGGIHDEPFTAMDATTAAGFDESKHRRYAKGTKVSGREGGGRFAPKQGDGVALVQQQAVDAAEAAKTEDQRAAAIPGQLELGDTTLTAERSVGRDVRLTGAMADGKVYRVVGVKPFGSVGNTLVTMVDADGNERRVVGFVEVEDVSGGHMPPDAPMTPAPPSEPVPTPVPAGEPAPAAPGTDAQPLPDPEASPRPEPPAPSPEPPAPEPAKPETPAAPSGDDRITVTGRSLKPGDTFYDSMGRQWTVDADQGDSGLSRYVRVTGQDGETRIMRRSSRVLVRAGDFPAAARRQQQQNTSHVTGPYGVFDKTPGPGSAVTKVANIASSEAGTFLEFPKDMPRIGALKETRSMTMGGQYSHTGGQKQSGQWISLRRDSDQTKLEAVSAMHHEFGHHLDISVLQQNVGARYEMASKVRDPAVAGPVMDAIEQSAAGRRISAMLEDVPLSRGGQYRQVVGDRSYAPDRAHLRYVAQPTEKFARAYEQYVATKVGQRLDYYHGNAAMPLHDTTLDPGESMMGFYGWYWDPEDFKPISDEFDRMFGRLGWLKQTPTSEAASTVGVANG